jgi:hypothetical protein
MIAATHCGANSLAYCCHLSLRGVHAVALAVAMSALISVTAETKQPPPTHLENTGEWPVCVGEGIYGEDKKLSPKDVLDVLDKVEMSVPNVPPEEAKYISKEYYEATQSGPRERLELLKSRPYYDAWDIRDRFDRAKHYVKELKFDSFDYARERRVTSLSSSDDIKYQISHAASVIPDLSDLYNYWIRFVYKHLSGTPASSPQGISIQAKAGDMWENAHLLVKYIQCLLNLPDDKK